MFKAQEIVDNVLRLVDQKSARSKWFVTITNKDENNEQGLPDYVLDLFKQSTLITDEIDEITDYLQKSGWSARLKSTYYEATDYKEARKAVSLLLRQGFTGISDSPSLTDFKFVRVDYLPTFPNLPEDSGHSIGSKPMNKPPDTGYIPHSPIMLPEKSGPIRKAIIIMLVVFFFLATLIGGAIVLFRYNNSLYAFNTPELDQVLLKLDYCDKENKRKEDSIKYTTQSCRYREDSQSHLIPLRIKRSDQMEALAELELDDICVQANLRESSETVYYIKGKNFWIYDYLAIDKEETNSEIQKTHRHLSDLGLDEIELLDWCQSDYSRNLQQERSIWREISVATEGLDDILIDNFECEPEKDPSRKEGITRQRCSPSKTNGDVIDLDIYRSESQADLIDDQLSLIICETTKNEKHRYILGDKFLARVSFVYNPEDSEIKEREARMAELNDQTKEMYKLLAEAGLEAKLLDWCQQDDSIKH